MGLCPALAMQPARNFNNMENGRNFNHGYVILRTTATKDAKLEPSAQTYRSAGIASLLGPHVSLHFNLGGGETIFRTYLGVGAGTNSRHKGSIDGRNDLT